MGLDIQGLSFSYGDKEILKDISLKINDGDFVSIIGPNGAGKTTLVKCLNRILKAVHGTILVDGKLQAEMSQKELAQKISYVPQMYETHLQFSAYEFVLLGRYPHFSPFASISKEDSEMAIQCMQKTSCLDLKDREMSTLSGGECQRVFIAAALAQGANILVLDEPSNYLDPKHQVEMYQLLSDLNDNHGMTVVMVTHDINSAIQYAKKILAIKSGEVAFWGEAEGLLKDSVLQAVFETSFKHISGYVFPEIKK